MPVMSSFRPAFDVRGAGTEMMDNVARGQEVAARHRQRKALDAYNELPAYDPEAMTETPDGFVGPPEIDAGQAWEEHVERQLAAARAINPELELQLRPILQEQHRRLASTAVSQAGFYAGTGQLEQAQTFADRFTQLMAPGTGYRVTAELEPGPHEEGKKPVVVFRGPDGQLVDTNFMLDALGKATDPLEWEKAKAYMNALAVESAARAEASRRAGQPDAPELPERLSPKEALDLAKGATSAMAEGGILPDELMSHLSTETRTYWTRKNVVPPAFRPLWDSATAEIFNTMGPEGVSSPDEAALMGFHIAASLENTGPGAVPLVFARGQDLQVGDYGPGDVLIVTMPDGAEAVLGWESPMAKRLRRRHSLNEDDGRLPTEEPPPPPSATEEPPPPPPPPGPPKSALPPAPAPDVPSGTPYDAPDVGPGLIQRGARRALDWLGERRSAMDEFQGRE